MRTFVLSAIAFSAGFGAVAFGVSQTRFLWGAWLHAGF